MPEIRLAQIQDINYLMDIDLKSYYSIPFCSECWNDLVTNSMYITLLAAIKMEPVGLCVYHNDFVIHEVSIIRFTVKPAYRNQGVGTALLQAVEANAEEYNLPKIGITIPEMYCVGSNNISQFFSVRGFRAISILHDSCIEDGEARDSFEFIKEMNYESTPSTTNR